MYLARLIVLELDSDKKRLSNNHPNRTVVVVAANIAMLVTFARRYSKLRAGKTRSMPGARS